MNAAFTLAVPLVVFATKAMNKTPNTSLECTFKDEASIDPTLAADVKLACQLGLFR